MTDGDSASLLRMRGNVVRNMALITKTGGQAINSSSGGSDSSSGSNSGSSSSVCSSSSSIDIIPCESKSIVHCKQLRWGQHLQQFKEHCALPSNGGCFDVVMGSDIIYTNDILDPLFETVDYLLKKNISNDDSDFTDICGSSNSSNSNGSPSRGVFILAYARRNVKIDDVFATAEKYGFQWSAPEEAEGCFVFCRKLNFAGN
jgi:hypothetical protein